MDKYKSVGRKNRNPGTIPENFRLSYYMKIISINEVVMFTCIACVLCISFMIFMMSFGSLAAHAENIFKASAAVRTITPKGQAYMAGLASNRKSEGVHDDIYARCLILNDGATKLGIVGLDLIGLLQDDVNRIRKKVKEKGIELNLLIIASTHLHSGPDTIGLWGASVGESGVDPKYMSYLTDQTVEVIEEAYKGLKPARLKFASTIAPEGVSRNARIPDLIDREISVIKAEDESGKTTCTLINFAAHPETLWSDNHLITSDYPAYIYRHIEEKLGGVALFLNGALGGMVTVANNAHTFEESERIGLTIAQSALVALQNAKSSAVSSAKQQPKISIRSAEIEIPMENQNFMALSQIGVLPKRVEGKTIKSEVNLIKISSSAESAEMVAEIATVPGELLPKLGLKVKEAMKAKYKFIIGLGCDELGYIIPEEDFSLELYKYERSMSVGSKAGTIISEKLSELMSH